MIEVKNLKKLYGNHTAVDNISFNIEKGKIYGFLGQNGAGKSTTMNIITGCLAATDGSVKINGYDIFKSPIAAKKHIGYLPELPPLYLDMTVGEYLAFVAEAKGVSHELAYRQVKEAMELTQIDDVESRIIKTLSKGYKQRVGIAQALLGSPDVIILDEPTVGLDPRQITEIRALIRKLGESKTVIISSHILAEISEVCDHVIIISRGKIVADAEINKLEESLNEESVIELKIKCGVELAEEIFDSISSITSYTVEELGELISCKVIYNRESDPAEELFLAFAKSGAIITDMHHKRLTLEDIFLKLTEEVTEEIPDNTDVENDYVPVFANEENDAKEDDEQ